MFDISMGAGSMLLTMCFFLSFMVPRLIFVETTHVDMLHTSAEKKNNVYVKYDMSHMSSEKKPLIV